MKKFSKLLENTFKQANLKKVRLKVDPAFCERGEISKYQGYDGYILAEIKKDKNIEIYIEELEIIATVPEDMVDCEVGSTKFEQLKLNALVFLKEEKGMASDSPLITMIMHSTSIQMFESYLLNNGCSDKDLIAIYRIEYESTESIPQF